MKSWMRNLLIAGGVLVVVLGLVATFGGWLNFYLGALSITFFLGLAVVWKPIKYWAAAHHPWWSFWAFLEENSFFARTDGNSIRDYFMNPSDPVLRAELIRQRDVEGRPYHILPPGRSLVTIGNPFIYGLKHFAPSEMLQDAAGIKKHAASFIEDDVPLPKQLPQPDRDKLEADVKAAMYDPKVYLSPAEVEKLLDIPYLLSKDGIAVAVSLHLYYEKVNPELFFTSGRFHLDKMRGQIVSSCQWCLAHLDFLGDASGDGSAKQPDAKLVQKIQHYLNVYLGLEQDAELEAQMDRHTILPKNKILGWGIRLNQALVTDVEETTGEITQAMQKKAVAEATRDADLVAADATAKVTERVAKGQKEADVTRAEGKKLADILAAEGKKQADILQAEGQKQSTILSAEGELEAGRKLAERDRITLEQRILAFGGAINAGTIAAYLHDQGIKVRGLNMANAGRVYLTDTSGHSTYGSELLALIDLLKHNPTTKDVVEAVKGKKKNEAPEEETS